MMKIEVGKTYITRDGRIVEVQYDSKYPFRTSGGHSVDVFGRYYSGPDKSPNDLIAEVEQGVPGEITVKVPAGTKVGIEYLPPEEPPEIDWAGVDDAVKIRKEGGCEISGHARALDGRSK